MEKISAVLLLGFLIAYWPGSTSTGHPQGTFSESILYYLTHLPDSGRVGYDPTLGMDVKPWIIDSFEELKAKGHANAPVLAPAPVVEKPTVLVPITSLVKTGENSANVLRYLTTGENIRRAHWASIQLKGCPVSLLLAQDGIECGWGGSELTQATNNTGNVKCRCNWNKKLRAKHNASNNAGEVVCVSGWDSEEGTNHRYQAFKTRWQGWQKKIKTLSSYKAIKALPQGATLEQWITAIDKSPYASTEHYGTRLRRVIRAYNFTAIDEAIANGHAITTASNLYVLWKP